MRNRLARGQRKPGGQCPGIPPSEILAPRASHEEKRLWTLRECADFLGLSKPKVKDLVDRGILPHLWLDPERPAGRWGLRFRPESVRAFVAKREG